MLHILPGLKYGMCLKKAAKLIITRNFMVHPRCLRFSSSFIASVNAVNEKDETLLPDGPADEVVIPVATVGTTNMDDNDSPLYL